MGPSPCALGLAVHLWPPWPCLWLVNTLNHLCGSWHLQGILIFKANPALLKISPFLWYLNSDRVFREGTPRGGRTHLGLNMRDLISSVLQGTAGSCWGARGSWCSPEASWKRCRRGQASTSRRAEASVVVSFLFSRERNNHPP